MDGPPKHRNRNVRINLPGGILKLRSKCALSHVVWKEKTRIHILLDSQFCSHKCDLSGGIWVYKNAQKVEEIAI